jgi:prepilin-type N-terminal cleavage/methylation domain-containing protein
MSRRRAFTLIELLVAMVLTLILVTAIAQFYAIVGDSVKDGRAIIEMGGQLRAAVERLKDDLDLITCATVPWIDYGAASGYFEYREGVACDFNANGNFTQAAPILPIADSAEDMVNVATNQANPNGQFDLLEYGVTNMVGDGDDFLAFTIRSSGQPFTGRYTYPVRTTNPVIPIIYTSQLAEVVWWVSFEDQDNDQTWDFNEPRQLHRRQLLIRPDLDGIDDNFRHPNLNSAIQRLHAILQENDISLSIRTEFDPQTGNRGFAIRANSLADLTKREHRFAHIPADIARVTPTGNPTPPPYLADANFPHRQFLLPSLSAKTPNLAVPPTVPFSHVLQARNGTPGESPGEDVMLSNVLAFDVQAYDPYARIWPDDPTNINNSTVALLPSDPGYGNASIAAKTIVPVPLLGLGAYVDLGYYRYLPPAAQNESATVAITQPYFARAPSIPLALAALPTAQATYLNLIDFTYDTWSLNFERDAIFQYGNTTNYGPISTNRMDAQTNGIDDDSANGVDDANERETVPPYSQPLRGIQVKIRILEPSTRQVRQQTVAADFLTE